jgi:putative two-component system response regulator
MHDIGKVAVPDAILFKPGPLDDEERKIMQVHAQAGYGILSESKSALVRLAAEIAVSHHERWDGGGYPAGLSRDRIPLSGRITAVADVCDALLSDRPYKKAWTPDEVRAYLMQNSGKHFDPRCVEALLSNWDKLLSLYRSKDIDAVASSPVKPAQSGSRPFKTTNSALST